MIRSYNDGNDQGGKVMGMKKLSVCITTLNNERSLGACLESVKWADEIVVLDSFSTDKTLDISRAYGCRLTQHRFMGYGKQKQMAIDSAENQWILLLDSDEALSTSLQERIKELMQVEPPADGYEFPRLEQMFWRMNNPRTRLNYYRRLFDRSKCQMSTHTVHESPQVRGIVERIEAPFYHYSEIDLRIKVEKVNAYSTGSVVDKAAKGKAANPWIMVFYPPFYFVRLYFFKRNFLNGWAGFMGSVVGAFYAFLKYAKLYEYHQRIRYGDSLLPPGAPPSQPDGKQSRVPN